MILRLPKYLLVPFYGQTKLGFMFHCDFKHFDFGLAIISFYDHGISGLNSLILADVIIRSSAGSETDTSKPVFRAEGLLSRNAVEAVLVGLGPGGKLVVVIKLITTFDGVPITEIEANGIRTAFEADFCVVIY